MKRYKHVLIGILLLIIVSTLLEPSFLKMNNIMNILRQASILFCLSLGLTAVVLTGQIDLSVGSVAALTGCVCAKLMVSGHSVPVAILSSMVIGIIAGIMNGFLVAAFQLPSFVSTYGVQMVASGLALIVMKGGVIYDLPKGFTFFGIGYVGAVPFPILLAAGLCLIMYVVLEHTCYGRNIYMLGQNKMAALYSGANTFLLHISSFMVCGFFASLGGIIMTARLNAADAGMCEAYGLQIVAAVVVGGTSLLGGEGGVPGTALGAIILTMILNIMNMTGVQSAWQNLVLGVIMIVLVFVNRISGKTINPSS